uniref:Uncharacterized protein n=1 Tax=Paraburkholderia sprentiae WSM5005 TaxID=754502 RepID=A0A1I9YQ71_9BURK
MFEGSDNRECLDCRVTFKIYKEWPDMPQAMIFARNKPHQAISNADSIAGYIATFDGVNIAP